MHLCIFIQLTDVTTIYFGDKIAQSTIQLISVKMQII